MKLICLLLIVGFASGCATQYVAPKASDAAAVFGIPEKELGSPVNKVYSLYDNEGCEITEGFGLAANLSSAIWLKKTQVQFIPSGKRLYIRGKSLFHAGKSYECVSVGSFIPETSKTYVIELSGKGGHCKMNVTEEAGEEVESFNSNAPVGKCD